MCMCRPVIDSSYFVGPLDAVFELLVPDAVLRLLAAGVHLLAVAVAEAGVDPQRDAAARACRSPYWSIMSGEPQLTWMSCFDDQVERLAVEDVGRVDDLRRVLRLARLEAGGHRPVDFAGAHAIDQHAVAAHEVENRQVRAGLLGVADDVERRQVGDPLGRSSRRRRRTPACRTCWAKCGNRLAGDFGENAVSTAIGRHACAR